MKKKKKDNKKQDMPEFQFKEFTAEESRIYEEAISKFRDTVAAGKQLGEAYASYSIADKELESVIHADFLKILIAERHFGKREPLEKIAIALGISVDVMKETQARMLQEVGITAANQFGQQFSGFEPKTND